MYRRPSKEIKVGNLFLGGNNPIRIQSMLTAKACEKESALHEAQSLIEAGCEIIRIAIPDKEAVSLIPYLKERISAPLVADIHFDAKLAIESVNAGIDKIRINPGNIGSDDKVKSVADACRLHNVPIRIGVNGGSLEKEILAKHGHPTGEALAESALYHASLLEKFEFNDIVLSAKSSDTYEMIRAYQILGEACGYPLHLGVTEAGSLYRGIIKNSVGIGALLSQGIGDTIRVSLTAPVNEEVKAAKAILEVLGLRKGGVEVVSCPTCGRTQINIIKLVSDLEDRITKESINTKLKVAVMGCVVNGPGEARDADIGIAGGVGEALLFKKGEILYKIPEDKIVDTLIGEIKKYGE